jgi:hypothetical protein
MQKLPSVGEFHGALLFSRRVSHAEYRVTRSCPGLFVNCSPAVGTNAAICNEEGFGTLSRQLGNDEGYRSSRVGVSGCFTRWPVLDPWSPAAAGNRSRLRHRPVFDAWSGSAHRRDVARFWGMLVLTFIAAVASSIVAWPIIKECLG